MGNIEKRQKVFDHLGQLGIEYSVTEHPAVFSIDEMRGLGIIAKGEVCKNLFLRDAAGKRHFLVILPHDKTVSMKTLQQKLDTTRLSFASHERLALYLKLAQGEVTPFGILNDGNRNVELIVDASLAANPCLGVHPNDNTATLWISFNDLYRAVEAFALSIRIVDLSD
jgi:Uncharacterized conserved protein